ncbi:MAG: response regulator [Acetatifactor sp.]|nr:response regulator [Acetatifactor sp.]
MTYVYEYELAAAFFMAVLYIFLKLQYSSKILGNRLFQRLTFMAMLADGLDVVAALAIDRFADLSFWTVMLVNTVYFIATMVFGVYFVEYAYYLRYKERHIDFMYILTKLIAFAYIVMMLHNSVSGYVFYFDENGNYIHGSLYMLVYFIPFFYYVISVISTIIIFPEFTVKQRISTIIYACVALSGSAIQLLVASNYLLSMFTMCLGIVMMFFTLQTPDYQKLMDTMLELEKTKKETEEARDEADRANKSKSDFLATMSHEIRTPINSILGMDEILLRENLSDSQRQYALNIKSAGNSLLSLINDILDLSKIETGKLDIVPGDYDLAELLKECYSLVEKRAADKELELKVINDPSIPRKLMGDANRVRQVIVNVLNNAVKYTQRGYVYLGIGWKSQGPTDLLLKISVEDSGIGIAPDNIDKIFEAYTRSDEKKTKNIEGTGLGLSITKQLVDLMGGSIRVESEVDKGSTFFIEIPQKTAERTTRTSYQKLGMFYKDIYEPAAFGKKYHEKFRAPGAVILAVDDVVMNLEVVRGLLRQTQIKVEFAESGMEALEKIQEKHYDLILMDHMMPHMSGLEVFKRMKEMEHLCKTTPVIILTANALAGEKEEYLKLGFDDYLAKPIKGKELEEMLFKYIPRELIVTDDDFSVTFTEPAIDEVIHPTQNFARKNSENTISGTNDGPELDYVDEELGLMYMGDDRMFYDEVRTLFVNDNKVDEINAYFEAKDWKNYAVLMHALKSTSLNIGAKNLSDAAFKLEKAAKETDTLVIEAWHEKVMTAYKKVIDKIKNGRI